jgi:hypothetical protein
MVDSDFKTVADLAVSQERLRRQHRLTQAIRAFAKPERADAVADALTEIVLGERRQELARRFAKLSDEEKERLLSGE